MTVDDDRDAEFSPKIHSASGGLEALYRAEVQHSENLATLGDVVIRIPSLWLLILWLIIGIIIAGAVWLNFTEFNQVRSAVGYTVPYRGLIHVRAIRSGVVSKIHVIENEIVDLGDVLATVNIGGDITAQGDDGPNPLIASPAKRDRAFASQLAIQKSQAVLEGRCTREKFSNMTVEPSDREAQRSMQSTLSKSMTGVYKRTGEIEELGIIAKPEIERRRQFMLADRNEDRSLAQQLITLNVKLRQAEVSLEESPTLGAARGSESRNRKPGLDQQKLQSMTRDAYAIRAASGGRVIAVFATPSRFVEAGSVIAMLAPDEGGLEAELYLPADAIDQVELGQSVRIFLEAFPHERFGAKMGRVHFISRTILSKDETPEFLNISKPVYRVNVTLNQPWVEVGGRCYPLRRGMLLEARIIVRKTSALTWLFDRIGQKAP